jgi:hypothetical protein
VKLQLYGADFSPDGGLLPYRDLDEALAFTAQAVAQLADSRTGSNIRHSLLTLLRQSLFSRLAGYEDVNDAERLGVDPVMRHIVGGRATERDAASTSEINWFETRLLTRQKNLAALMAMPG